MVSTHLKNISQIRSFPQVGMKITNDWNCHPATILLPKNKTTSQSCGQIYRKKHGTLQVSIFSDGNPLDLDPSMVDLPKFLRSTKQAPWSIWEKPKIFRFFHRKKTQRIKQLELSTLKLGCLGKMKIPQTLNDLFCGLEVLSSCTYNYKYV